MALFASLFTASITVIAAILPAIDLPGHGAPAGPPPYPAPPGYVLPWPGGEIHRVTQGEETSLTHNGSAAYAFDFDLSYDTVVAARGGKVTMVRESSNMGGCSALFRGAANYAVIDHGDGTSGLYLHLAQDAVLVKPGDLVAQGQPIAVSGETGLTCSDRDNGPGAHLHFQVERTVDNRYFTQSLPIAFDDIAKDGGIPKSDGLYISGNYGRGRQQKIKLTPHRVPRPFAPVATPADPTLIEAEHIEVAPVAGEDTATPEPPAEGIAAPEASNTVRPTRTPSVTPTPTPTPSATPIPTDTPTPVPTDTPSPIPTDTPLPIPTDTPVPPDTATPTDTATPEPPPP